MMGSALEKEVALAIEAMAPTVETTGLGWRFKLGLHPHAAEIDARVDDGWVLLDMPLESAPTSYATLAEANARLSGGVKFAFVPDDERVHARAELPLLVDVDLAERLFEAGRGFEQASALAHGGHECAGSHERADGASCVGADSNAPEPAAVAAEGELDRLCEEAGWAFNRRSGGCIAVELEGTEGFFQAMLERRADGAVALSIAIEDCHPIDGACAEAAAIFLLRFSGWLRMARGVGALTGERAAPRFEVVFPLEPSPSELSEALAALSVAIRFGARELHALARSARVARSYLAWNAHLAWHVAPKHALENTKTVKPKGTSANTKPVKPNEILENTNTVKPRKKRRVAAANGQPTSTRGGAAKRSPGTRKKPQHAKGEMK